MAALTEPLGISRVGSTQRKYHHMPHKSRSSSSSKFHQFVPLRKASTDPEIGTFIKTADQVYWQVRNRERNGLDQASAVFKGKDGQWWIHKPRYLAWFVGEEPQNHPIS